VTNTRPATDPRDVVAGALAALSPHRRGPAWDPLTAASIVAALVTAGHLPEPADGGRRRVAAYEPDSAQADVAHILAAVAARFGVDPADLTGQSRKHVHAIARQAAMLLCRELLALSYPKIGTAFGGRDHATVISGLRAIGVRAAGDPDLQARIDAARAALTEPDAPEVGAA
jgi:hypothetical protein